MWGPRPGGLFGTRNAPLHSAPALRFLGRQVSLVPLPPQAGACILWLLSGLCPGFLQFDETWLVLDLDTEGEMRALGARPHGADGSGSGARPGLVAWQQAPSCHTSAGGGCGFRSSRWSVRSGRARLPSAAPLRPAGLAEKEQVGAGVQLAVPAGAAGRCPLCLSLSPEPRARCCPRDRSWGPSRATTWRAGCAPCISSDCGLTAV